MVPAGWRPCPGDVQHEITRCPRSQGVPPAGPRSATKGESTGRGAEGDGDTSGTMSRDITTVPPAVSGFTT
jgi:hypothetical protein